MNTQLCHIKCYSSCFFFSFLEQNCSAFTNEILIIVIKNAFLFSFLFLFFLYATIRLVYVMIAIFQKRYNSFLYFFLMIVAPFIMFFKIVFNSVQLEITQIFSLRSIYSIFKMESTVLLFSIRKTAFPRTIITSYI